MKIKLIAFEDGLVSMGLRRISSYTKQHYDQVETFFYNVEGNSAFVKNVFFSNRKKDLSLNAEFVARCADSDVVGVSCMSTFSHLVQRFIKELRAANPNVYVVWGGSHAIMDPDDAIQHADAVCTAQEGEKVFVELLDKFDDEARYGIHGFTFRKGTEIIKNPQSPLLTPDEFDTFPFQDFSDEVLYVDRDQMVPTDKRTYLNVQGTKYTTIWSIGCPFPCGYCGNTKFLENDGKYARARYQRPETLIAELEMILAKYDFISFIEFQDDNFFLIHDEDIIRFAELYREKIGLPFFIPGIFPGLIRNEEALDALIDAGLRKVRMGIQSGSDKTLKMFQRPTKRPAIVETANQLISRYPRLSPPFFDIIMDIPTEDAVDKRQTIDLLQSFKRPFFLYIYSLRVIPNTSLYQYSLDHPEIDFIPIQESYQHTLDERYALQLYMIAAGASKSMVDSVPRWFKQETSLWLRLAAKATKAFYFSKRFFYELGLANMMPIAVAVPGLPWLLYKVGVLAKHREMVRRKIQKNARERANETTAQTLSDVA